MEDYLETILILERKNRVARVKDIASMLNVQMPSVTGALKNLRDRGLIHYEKNSFINLTEEGMAKAERVKKKHFILLRFLESVLDERGDEAENEACSLEHHLSLNTALKIERLTEYFEEGFQSGRLDPADWKKIIKG